MAEKKTAASVAELAELHRLIAASLKQRIEQDMQDGVPTDAATLGAAIKFLKDNAITADPADADELHALRERLKQAAEERQRAKLKQGSEAIKTGTGPVALFPIDEDDF